MPSKENADGEPEEKPWIAPDEIHSRSVMLGPERLGVVAKMDLVEATLGRDGTVAAVCPVDYKVGAPREGEDGRELWDADRMQLGLQCLVLRDNGYACDTGINGRSCDSARHATTRWRPARKRNCSASKARQRRCIFSNLAE